VPIRLRLALLFAAAAVVAAAIGGEVFAAQLHHGLLSSLDQGLRAEWTEVARHATTTKGHLEHSSATSSTERGVVVGSRGSQRPTTDRVHPTPTMYLAQVVTPSGKVLSENGTTQQAALLTGAVLRRAAHHSTTVDLVVAGHRLRLLAGPVPGTTNRIAVVGASLRALESTMAEVRRALTAGALALVAASGLAAYFLARAALGPVERMRRQVEALEPAPGVRTLDVPETGDEIARLAETMNELLDRLGTSLARQRALVADAGHELRTPLTVVLGELELAERAGRSPEEMRSGIGRARREAERLALLAERILLLASSDDGQLHVDPKSLDLARFLDSVADRHRRQRPEVALEIDCPDTLAVLADPELLTQALDNLLSNALRVAPKGSTIVCGATLRNDHQVAVFVQDQGPGFPPGLLPRAFERFARAEPGRSRSSGGAGLGLAIVAVIAQAHGGTASASNPPQGGALVQMTLPRAPAPRQDGTASATPSTSLERSRPHAR